MNTILPIGTDIGGHGESSVAKENTKRTKKGMKRQDKIDAQFIQNKITEKQYKRLTEANIKLTKIK